MAVRKEMSPEEKEFQKLMQQAIAEMKNEFNGCPLFEGRDKGDLDNLTGIELRIADLYPLNDYHCVIFDDLKEDDPAHEFVNGKYFLTGGALKDLCNNYPPEFVVNRLIEIQPMVQTKSRNKFRPIKVLG